MIYFILHRSPNVDNAPFQNDLTKEWKVPKVNSYTAYQSPLLAGEDPLPGIILLRDASELHLGLL